MGDTASLGLSMARTSEACAAVVILVWRCQFTLRGVCMQEHASRAPRTFYMQGWKPRGNSVPPTQSVVVCGERLEHSCLYQDV